MACRQARAKPWRSWARRTATARACRRRGRRGVCLGPPVSHQPFLGEGSPTKIDYGKKGTRILTSLLEDLGVLFPFSTRLRGRPK